MKLLMIKNILKSFMAKLPLQRYKQFCYVVSQPQIFILLLENKNNKKPNAQRGGLAQAGAQLARKFVRFRKFCTRANGSETPACRQAAGTLCGIQKKPTHKQRVLSHTLLFANAQTEKTKYE